MTLPACQFEECSHSGNFLGPHIKEEHDLSLNEYLEKFPGAPTTSSALMKRMKKSPPARRRSAPASDSLTRTLMGIKTPVDPTVPASACLPFPDGYKWPTKGKAKKPILRALRGLLAGRNVFLWGMPGTGKDAVVHAVSALLRKPAVMVSFKPGTDISPMFFTRSINSEGTSWEYGVLWRALTEGIPARDGKNRPALVLLSDVDRADQAQAEWFRLLTDSISGRILGPDGSSHALFPGTQFFCTANSCGTGDSRGRMTSANPIDGSLMDRLGRKIKAEYLHWDDESQVLRGKYPKVDQALPDLINQLGNATLALRRAIEAEEVYAEFTHRSLCDILDEAADIIEFTSSRSLKSGKVLSEAFLAWAEGLDELNFLSAKRLIDPHISGGSL